MTHGSGSRLRNVYWQLLAVVLAALGATCLVLGNAQATRTPADAPGGGRVVEEAVSALPLAGPRGPSTQVVARPVKLGVPRLDLATRLMELGLQADGSVEVPRDAAVAGWFRRGPTPGMLGSSVILGHVDSMTGPGVFFGLSRLERGDPITVELDDGSIVRFEVRSVRTYLNADFPAQKVYGSHGRSELNLVTCGGAYDADLGGYQANVVVNALKVSGS